MCRFTLARVDLCVEVDRCAVCASSRVPAFCYQVFPSPLCVGLFVRHSVFEAKVIRRVVCPVAVQMIDLHTGVFPVPGVCHNSVHE